VPVCAQAGASADKVASGIGVVVGENESR